MKYSLVIYAAPSSQQGADTALRFAESALKQGHDIYRVFFYSNGVHNGSALAVPPQDEVNIPQRWQSLAQQHNLDLVICIAAALRRGLLDQQEADRYGKEAHNCSEDFSVSGLGQLLDASVQSDRLITFG